MFSFPERKFNKDRLTRSSYIHDGRNLKKGSSRRVAVLALGTRALSNYVINLRLMAGVIVHGNHKLPTQAQSPSSRFKFSVSQRVVDFLRENSRDIPLGGIETWWVQRINQGYQM